MKYGNIFIGLVLGAFIWVAYPFMTGFDGPDAGPITIYLFVLFISGVFSAFPKPSNWWKGVIGIYVGQWLYIVLIPHVSHYWFLGMVITALYMLASAAGGVLVLGIWKYFSCKIFKNDR